MTPDLDGPARNPDEAQSGSEFDLRLDGSARHHAIVRTAAALQVEEEPTHSLTVLIPMRDEASNIQGCLESLLAQSEPGFLLGEQWHLIVIDDGSTDDSYSIAERLLADRDGAQLLRAPEYKRIGGRGAARPTGKNAALWYGASQPVSHTAAWLLFTDADTLHEPASLSRAVVEAERHSLGLLSYSPRQIATGLVQRALLPVIFSELASSYPPKKVADASSPVAAANGQFVLVRADAYYDAGGHNAVADRVLEDVALARLIKRRHAIRLRYAPEAVSARMYRSAGEMLAGWTKNLALLFPNPLFLAGSRLLDFLLLLGLPLLPWIIPHLVLWQEAAIAVLWVRVLVRYYGRISRSHAPLVDLVLSVFALPLFAVLLVRSWQQVSLLKRVTWKGREYTP